MRRLVVVAFVGLVASRAEAGTFVVTSTGDAPDALPGDGVCLTAGTDCSLRAAIMEANATGVHDTIEFQIPGSPPHVIAPATGLPAITNPITIAGPGLLANAAQVVIDGTNASGASGLSINIAATTTVCSISGIGIRAFAANGITLVSSNCTFRSNVITGNGANGISIVSPSVPASPIIVGGTGMAEGNIITANGNTGISVGTVAPVQIRGNYIGISPGSTVAESNLYGVLIGFGNDHVVDSNTISGNVADGVLVSESAATISNNRIGTDASGSAAVGNGTGIRFILATSGTVSSNTVSANDAGIVVESESKAVTISNNLLGTNTNGGYEAGFENNVGILVQSDAENTAISGNTIAGSTTKGIEVIGATTTGTTITSNVLGRDTASLPAGNQIGISIAGNTARVVIGGTGLGNTIVNSAGAGIVAPTGGHVISQNVIRDNGALGIDLGNPGVSANGSGLQDFPVVASASRYQSQTMVSGTVVGPASTNVTVEIFGNAACDPSGNGEGDTLLGSGTVMTDAGGNAAFLIAATPVSDGVQITTTATAAGATSEFSACVATTSCAPITVAPDTAPGSVVGMAYTQAFTANGMTAGYTFTTTGSVPPGLTMAANGVLSGTPTAAGTYMLTVVATDANGCAGTVPVTIKVCPVISVSPTTIADGTTQTDYNIMFAASGGTAPYTYAFTGQPIVGLTLDPDTGAYTGKPTAFNSYVFTLTATDANSCTGSREYTVNVSLCDVSIRPTELPEPKTGTPYDAMLMTMGAVTPVTYAVTSGTLPAGLSLSGDHITGTPTTVGPSAFTLQGTAADGCVGTRAYNVVTTCGGLTIGPASLDTGIEGVPYSMQLTASGGEAPYTFTAQNLPPGISISASGELSGTPQSGLTQSILVVVSDAMGCMGTQSYTLEFEPANDEGCCSTSRKPHASSLLLALLVMIGLRRRRR